MSENKSLSSNEQWKKENTKLVTFRLMNSSGIPEALNLAERQSGKTKSGYIIAALKEALIRDGYLPSEKKEDSLAFRMRNMAKDYNCEIGEIVTMALQEREIYERESGAAHITATQAVLELLDIYEKSMNRSEKSE